MSLDANRLKLGKRPPVHPRNVAFLHELFENEELPKAPDSYDGTQAITDWGMMANDAAGDCVDAGYFHGFMIFDKVATGKVTRPTDDEILKLYEQQTGFDPQTGENDTGLVESEFLEDAVKKGWLGRQLGSVAKVRLATPEHLKVAIYLFNFVYNGTALPYDAQEQLQQGQPWDVTTGPGAEPGSWGGHCMITAAYDSKMLKNVTWGTLQELTWAWYNTYTDESYILIPTEYEHLQKPLANGMSLEKLRQYAKQI